MIPGVQEATTGVQEVSQGMGLEQWAALAQIASAVATGILAVAVFSQIREARKQATATRETVNEMRQSRLEQERPQIIVDADFDQAPDVNVVVRNIGKGAAKDITFAFSDSMKSTKIGIKPLDKQPLFKNGLDFLAPGAEIGYFWDQYVSLKKLLEQRGLEEGIKVTSKYKSLAGELYTTVWTINPLLMGGRLQKRAGTIDIVNAINEVRNELARRIGL